jgi:hypothetical protein
VYASLMASDFWALLVSFIVAPFESFAFVVWEHHRRIPGASH